MILHNFNAARDIVTLVSDKHYNSEERRHVHWAVKTSGQPSIYTVDILVVFLSENNHSDMSGVTVSL